MWFYMFWNLHLAALPCGEGKGLEEGVAYNMEMRTLSFWNTVTTMLTTVTAIYVAN